MDKYGEVRDVYIPQDFYTKKPRGFAFVEFYRSDDASEALQRLDRFEMDGREISVVFAKDKRKSADEMRTVMGPRGGRGDSRDRGGGRDRRERSRERSSERRDRKEGDSGRSRSRERVKSEPGVDGGRSRSRSPEGGGDAPITKEGTRSRSRSPGEDGAR